MSIFQHCLLPVEASNLSRTCGDKERLSKGGRMPYALTGNEIKMVNKSCRVRVCGYQFGQKKQNQQSAKNILP